MFGIGQRVIVIGHNGTVLECEAGDYRVESTSWDIPRWFNQDELISADIQSELAALKAQQGEALAVEYGDGYEAGVKDGIRDLRGAIKLAIAQADISQRLAAVERVLAEYEAMYLKQ